MTQGALRCARLGQLVGGARRRRRRRRAVAEAVARAHLNVAIARSQHRAGRAGAGPRPLQRRRVGLLHVVGRAAARDACRPAKYISTSAHERGAMLARVPGAKGPHSGWTGCTMRWPAGCRAACSLRDAFVPVSGPATLACPGRAGWLAPAGTWRPRRRGWLPTPCSPPGGRPGVLAGVQALADT